MRNMNVHHNGTGERRQWVNLFPLLNQDKLAITYRLLEIHLTRGDNYDKNLNQLLKAVRFEMRKPVALVRRAEADYLSIPADAALPQLERQLMPHISTLVPTSTTNRLEFARLNAQDVSIAIAFLEFAFKGALYQSRDLWGDRRSYYSKSPLLAGGLWSKIDLYPGFKWGIVPREQGRLHLAVDTTVKYVDRAWLPERLNGADPREYLHRYCLYHYGHEWYPVQLWGFGQPIAQQRFIVAEDQRVTDVLSYTSQRWEVNPPPWVRNLDPESPSIIYRYPGKDGDRYGALALCKLLYSTADEEVQQLHNRSIMDPAERFAQIEETIRRYFQQAILGEQPIQVAAVPLQIERHVFPVPLLRFGQGHILKVSQPGSSQGTNGVPLEQLGQQRLRLALSPQAGPLDTSPFAVQYLLLPRSLPRAIYDDFQRRFIRAMRQVSGQQHYQVEQILYDDRQATSLPKQVQAIQDACDANSISRGYAFLVLPSHAKRDLHNQVKRVLWPQIHFQCARAKKIRSFYEERGGTFQPISSQQGKYDSYVRGCAFGMMMVNRKWLCALAEPLHYDAYIGIDVLHGMAGFTFVYDHGERIIFRHGKGTQQERLTTKQLATFLTKHLSEDLTELPTPPRSIIIHRDGRTFASELEGLEQAIRTLTDRSLLPRDVLVGVVDICKSTAAHLRLIEGSSRTQGHNPEIGSYYLLNAQEGLVCTTGQPFQFPGTAQPLVVNLVAGELQLPWVLEDVFALAQLTFAAPDKGMRLPITIKIADSFLEPIASQIAEEEEQDEAEGEGFEAAEEDAAIERPRFVMRV